MKKAFLGNFAKFTGKHLCQSLLSEALAQVVSCGFCEISRNPFFTEHLWMTASGMEQVKVLLETDLSLQIHTSRTQK